MDYQQFITEIKGKIALFLDPDMDLHTHTTLKNNGRKRIGLTINDKRFNISPTIYLEEFFKQFQNGLSLDTIAENIWDIYQEVKFDHSWNIESIKDFSAIKTRLSYKLIHTEKNQELLKTLPHTPFLDLAVVYYILLDVDDCGSATIPISNEFLSFWNIDLPKLHETALNNAPLLLPAEFKPMRLVVSELLGCDCDEEFRENDILFVLTNPLRNFGASCLLYSGILEQIACQLGENYYILPSSIHELIIIPESKSPEKSELEYMVKEINETQVDPEEVLTNTVYYYNFSTKSLT